MNIGERIRFLRKELCKNQTEFAEKIKYKQTAVGLWENGQRSVPNSAIMLICSEYHVNEEWLRNGTGAMFRQDESTAIAQLANEFGLDEFETGAIYNYVHLEESKRKAIKDYVKSLAALISNNDNQALKISYQGKNDSEIATNSDIEKELENYRRELEAVKREKISTASQPQEGNAG